MHFVPVPSFAGTDNPPEIVDAIGGREPLRGVGIARKCVNIIGGTAAIQEPVAPSAARGDSADDLSAMVDSISFPQGCHWVIACAEAKDTHPMSATTVKPNDLTVIVPCLPLKELHRESSRYSTKYRS